MADTPPAPTKNGSGLNTKMAGMPMWAWTAIGAAGAVIVWVWYKNRKTTAAGNTQTGQYTPSGNEGLSTDQYEALLAQLRDLQSNQAKDTDKDTDKDDDDKPHPKPPPGHHHGEKRVTSDGKLSLNQIASRNHTSAADIVSRTQHHHGVTGKFAAYVHRHHFTVKVPAGVSLWVPES